MKTSPHVQSRRGKKEDGLFKHEEVHEGIKAPEKILINHPEKYTAKDFVYNQEHGGQLSFAL